MKELVTIKRNEIFTNSLIIAKGTDNGHESIVSMIRKYDRQFKELGKLEYSDYLKSTGHGIDRIGKMYVLNEMQATFLLTLLRNNIIVVDFKLRLTKEFYRMRMALMERNTTEWQQTRRGGKLVRRKETDVLAQLKIYAENQREGKPYNHIYTNYTNLTNKAVGIETGMRDKVSFKTLQTIIMIEDMVNHVAIEEMQKGTYFKNIYQICKQKAELIAELAYLPEQKLLVS